MATATSDDPAVQTDEPGARDIMSVRPNFLIPGAPRCMTTALAYYLAEHPDVHFARVKEVNYFNRYYDKGDAWYLGFFENWNGEPAVGEASTRYMSVPEAAERIYTFNPAFKLIFSLRNPVDRAYSEYKRDVQTRGIEQPFDEQVRMTDRYIWPGQYHTHVQRFLCFFPQEQVYFAIFDDLVADIAGEMRRISEFLEIDPSFEFTRVNQAGINRSHQPNSLVLQRWIHRYLEHSYNDPTLVRYIKNVMRRILNAINHGNSKAFPPMRESTRAYLISVFEADVSALEALIDRDLSHWRQVRQS